MASRSLGTLTIDLIAKTAGFTQGMDRASRSAKKTGRDIDNSLSRSVDKAVSSLRTLAGVAGVGFSVQQVAQYADAFTGLQNRLRLVTDSQTELSQATNDLFDISLRTAQNIDSTAQVYQRFAQNADRLGLSLTDVADLTDTVSKAVAISGSSAESAQAALVQFGQALASGTLRGEELNSVLEQAPGLAQAIADGLNVPVGALRDLAKEGKITSEALITALRNAAAGVDQQFATRVLTLGQGFENLRTAVTEYVGRLDSAVGASNSLAESIDTIAQSISDASRGMGDIGREIDALKELFTILDEFAQDFLTGFRGGTDDITQHFQTSFADSFLATAKEIDIIAADFQGFFAGVQNAVETLGRNISVIFSNAWASVLRGAQEMLNGVIRAYNEVAALVNGPQLTELTVGSGSAGEIKSVFDAYVDGYREAAKGLGAYDELAGRLADRQIERVGRAANEEYSQLDRVQKKYGDVADASGKAGKKKADEGERYIDSLKRQLESVSKLTEYEILRQRMAEGAVTFSSQAAEDQALAYAQTIDFIREQEEAYKKLEESRKEFLSGIEGVPEFSGIDALIGGAAGEIIKTGEAAEELQEWYEAQLEAQREFLEQGVINEQEYADRVYEITKTNAERMESIQRGLRTASISLFQDMTSQSLSALETLGQKGSGIYKALFIANKAAAIAQAIINTEEGATKALAVLGPAGPPVALLIRAAGYTSVAAMAATTIAGMAHDGIDSVPQDGTWLLQKGERVTTAETSAKLDATLERINSDMRSSRTGNGTVVNVIEDPQRAGQVETRYEDDREIIDVVVADIRSDGRSARALEATYGLRRQGR